MSHATHARSGKKKKSCPQTETEVVLVRIFLRDVSIRGLSRLKTRRSVTSVEVLHILVRLPAVQPAFRLTEITDVL